jgi:anti-sigma factor RsiW
VTHLGQQLSALIDGELEISERERVLVHISKCRSCQDEAAALRMLKRRMNALGEACAGAGLTVRLMGLSSTGMTSTGMSSTGMNGTGLRSGQAAWPSVPPGGWPPPVSHAGREARTGRYFLAGSVAVFLAGLGTAAFIAGGEPQAQAPAPPVTPSVDVLFSHELNGTPAPRPAVRPEQISPLPPRPTSGP